jgi:hypothetical protein
LTRKGGLAWTQTALCTYRGSATILKKAENMVLFVAVNFKRLLSLERNYKWKRPAVCPRCGQCRLWGHGFVIAYFDGLKVGVYLRRYRCPGCGCVLRLRPRGYFKRFQASITDIYRHLTHRVTQGSYLQSVAVSRQRHWLWALIRNTTAYLGSSWLNRLPEAFERLVAMGKTPVSRFI